MRLSWVRPVRPRSPLASIRSAGCRGGELMSARDDAMASRLDLLLIPIFGLAFLVWPRKIFTVARVRGDSMEPILNDGDYVVGIRIPRRACGYRGLASVILLQRGSIVLVRPPMHLGRLEVKRVNGLAGDIRAWGDGLSGCRARIPPGHVFVTGSAAWSAGAGIPLPEDSRCYGPYPSSAVVARVFLRFRPAHCGKAQSRMPGSPGRIHSTGTTRILWLALLYAAVLSLLYGCGERTGQRMEQPSVVSTISMREGIDPDGAVYTLLADNRLVALLPGRTTVEHRLGTTPRVPSVGRYMELAADGETLFVLAPGSPGRPAHVAVIDARTARLRALITVQDADTTYRSLAVGRRSGKLYIFGNRARDAIVRVIDPGSGAIEDEWLARRSGGRDWYVYQGAVTHDETAMYISYHGPDTTGIDRLAIGKRALEQCPRATEPGVGCIRGHGAIEILPDGLLVASGEDSLLMTDEMGRLLREYDTGLGDNHLMEFALDADARHAYIVGSCGYTGGSAAIELTSGRLSAPVARSTPRILVAPAPRWDVEEGRICGERLAVTPTGTLIIAQTARPAPNPGAPGALLFLDKGTGRLEDILRLPSEPVDVLVAGRS